MLSPGLVSLISFDGIPAVKSSDLVRHSPGQQYTSTSLNQWHRFINTKYKYTIYTNTKYKYTIYTNTKYKYTIYTSTKYEIQIHNLHKYKNAQSEIPPVKTPDLYILFCSTCVDTTPITSSKLALLLMRIKS